MKWRRVFDSVYSFKVQGEEVEQRGPDEEDDADDLRQFVQASMVAALSLDEGESEVIDQGAPDLDQHRVLAGSQKAFDLEVFFDPFEEVLDLPSCLVNGGDGGGGELEVIGDEDEPPAGVRVDEYYHSKPLGISLA